MKKRFLSIWFPFLSTDWFAIRNPALKNLPFVLTAVSHGKTIITAVNVIAKCKGVQVGMALADARVLIPELVPIDDKPGLKKHLLQKIAAWSIRYTPFSSVDLPDGLLLDISGCAHLWGTETDYITAIHNRLMGHGYHVKISIAGSIGMAWATARYGKERMIVESGKEIEALLTLPPAALRLEDDVIERLVKLGLRSCNDFLHIPVPSLRRRFGSGTIKRLEQALGKTEEILIPVIPAELIQERLVCPDPIVNAKGIEIALQQLLEMILDHVKKEGKGIRKAVFKGYRIDGPIEKIEIGTNRATQNITHLFKLFQQKIEQIEPALGIELFVLEIPVAEDISPFQEKIWEQTSGLASPALAELLDRIAGKFGNDHVYRYLPAENYWPERSYRSVLSLDEHSTTNWKIDRIRPVYLLTVPEKIEVTAPIPDYPPMLFRYRQKLHKIIKADGPERIEQEWWLQDGQHRDYYSVEDEDGCKYWLFRSGHYSAERNYKWFIHGFFA